MKKKFIAISSGFILAITATSIFYLTEDEKTIAKKQSVSSEHALLESQNTEEINKNEEINQVNPGNQIEKIESKADFEKVFSTIEELTIAADVIIEGEVEETEYFDFNTNTFTKSKIKVIQSYTDNVNAGDLLTFVEIGGVTTKGALEKYNPEKIKVSEDHKNDPVEISLNGSAVMKKNENVLLFGVKSKDNIYLNGEEYYLPLGTYQGKFNINNGKVSRFAEKDSKQGTSLEMSIVTLKDKIQKSSRNK